MPEPVLRRHREKSAPREGAPRGRSPDAKSLQQAAKKARNHSGGYVTPPPRTRKVLQDSHTKCVKPRKIKFGNDSVHHIEAENPAPPKSSKEKKIGADAILNALKERPHVCSISCLLLLATPVQI